jgi:hypothetical protein
VLVAFERHGARLAALSADIRLVRDASIRRLTDPREGRRFFPDGRQVDPRLSDNQDTPNLALDLVVAPFYDPSTHQPPTTVEEVFRRRRVVSERTRCFGQREDSLSPKCSAIGVPANFSRSKRAKTTTELKGR